MLTVDSVSYSYGQVDALRAVSLTVAPGECVAVIGHNGAGKTTLLRCIAGLLKPREGSIHWNGKSMTGRAVASHVTSGIRLVPQGGNVFADLTVRENLELSMSGNGKAADRSGLDTALSIFPILKDKLNGLAAQLSGGQRQMLAVSIALVGRPQLLLLDEPSVGVAPVIVRDMLENVAAACRETGTAVVLVEQNVDAAFRVADRTYVLRTGAVLLEGEVADIQQREDLFTLL